MTKTEEWIAARIAEHAPDGGQGAAGIGDLLRAVMFFEGRASQVFGLSATRDAMPEADALRQACRAALRGWFDRLGDDDPAGQRELYEVATRHGVGLDLPEPASVALTRAVARERDLALAQLGRPSDALVGLLGVADLGELLAAGARVPLARLGKHVGLPRPLSMSQFEWCADDWSSAACAGLDPTFFPIAGADGDYLGLLVDAELAAAGVAIPLVYYFHEEDPVYTWVFEDCIAALAVVRAAEAKQAKQRGRCGVEHPRVTELLRRHNALEPGGERDAIAFERAGNSFAATNVRAQTIWREHEARIAALRPT